MTNRTRLAVMGALATVLTSSSLAAVFFDTRWILRVVGVVAAVTLGAELAAALGRRIGGAPVLRVVGGLAFGLCYVTAVYAQPVAGFGFLPNKAAFGYFDVVATSGLQDVEALRPPVPTNLGLTFLAVVGVGLVALVVNLLSSRPVLAGLPLLTMFAVVIALAPDGVGLGPFLLAAIGYVLLLAAEGRDRVERWGRALPGRRTNTAVTYGQVGRRIGVAALSLAVVVPMIVPGLDTNRLVQGNGLPGGINGDPSRGVSSSVNPLAEIQGRLLQVSAAEYYIYESSDGPQYLRLVVDDFFDGSAFRNSGVNSAVRAEEVDRTPFGLRDDIARKQVTVDVRMQTLDGRYLPVPLPFSRVEGVGGDWRFDEATETVYSPNSDTFGMQYRAVATIPQPTAEQLANLQDFDADDDEYFRRYLQLPEGLEAEMAAIGEVARRVTADAGTDWERARAMQEWFTTTGGFTYSEQGPTGIEQNALLEFLQDKRGYCVQFASTMALMARTLGIPSRVAVGFTGGSPAGGNRYFVLGRHAHAWPELFFPGLGWMRFEPTPAVNQNVEQPPWIPSGPGAPTASPGTDEVPDDIDEPITITPTSGGGGGLRPSDIGKLALVPLLLLGLATPALSARWRRHRRWSHATTAEQRAHAAWHDVLVAAENLGHRYTDNLSVRATGRRIADDTRLTRVSTQALQRVVTAEEYARYANTPPPGRDDVQAASRLVAEGLYAAASRRRRLWAMFLPPETMRVWRAAVASAVASGFEFVDRAFARLGLLARRLSPIRR